MYFNWYKCKASYIFKINIKVENYKYFIIYLKYKISFKAKINT